MTEVHLTFNNLNGSEVLKEIFPISNEFEFTSKKVFRRKQTCVCSCSNKMVHNGYDHARKKHFGKVRIGKQLCTKCGKQQHEDKSFWKKLLDAWKDVISKMILTLRNSDVSWRTVSTIMEFIIPCGKTKALSWFNEMVEPFEYPQDNFTILNYDEQHPKRGRAQRFRLTLLNYQTGIPVADGLFNSKNEETIKLFLKKHLDTSKEIVLITDCDRRYPRIFKELWGNKMIHQKCLLHLNKLVVKDFGKKQQILNEYNKYLVLNIFYNRKKELKFLERRLEKLDKKSFSDRKEKNAWEKGQLKKFRKYLRKLENKRRSDGKNLLQRPLWKAKQNFEKLWNEKGYFSKKVQDRLKMIKKSWKTLTAFYAVKDCPATNNAIENFYSTSLKTHRKKQLRTDEGLENHMKLAALKRVQDFTKPKKTVLEIYGLIKLIVS